MSLSRYENRSFRLAEEIGARETGNGKRETGNDRILKEKRGTSTDAALRLGWLFGTTPGFWMKLQTHYDPAPATTELRKVLETIRMLAA